MFAEPALSTLRPMLLVAGLMACGAAACAEETAPPAMPEALHRKFDEVYARIRQEYVDEVDDDKLFEDAIHGMVSGLDAHSAYIELEKMQDPGLPAHGEFGGLGIELAREDGWVTVVTPIEDTPAYRAGLRAGDRITHIDGVPAKGWGLNEAIRRMRGEPGSHVRLTVNRADVATPLLFDLERAVIRNPSVKWKLTDRDYPYLRITQFRLETAAETAKALRAISEENRGGLKGLVLDLRNNPGGSLASAVAVASLFLKQGQTVVSAVGRGQGASTRLLAQPQGDEGSDGQEGLGDLAPVMQSLPMVVLVNGGSASAAEIVAGALQDHGRAQVLGTPSFGKGTIQTLFPLSTGDAVRLTVARYFTPSGRAIQAKGIVPDELVEAPAREATPYSPGTAEDAQYRQAIRRLRGR